MELKKKKSLILKPLYQYCKINEIMKIFITKMKYYIIESFIKLVMHLNKRLLYKFLFEILLKSSFHIY